MSLVVEKQESLAQDTFTKNGVIKELHIVAKNISFTIHVKANFNLNHSPISAKLYYDFDEGETEPKEVETLKVTPLEYTSHVNESGDRAAVEIRIGVLSSQHEGAYFRVKISAADASTKKINETFSLPIKIISKRTQVKKILEKKQQQQAQISSPQSSPPSSFPEPASPIRSSNEALAQAIKRLEEQQREQSTLLKEICGRVNQPVSQTIPDPSESDFETAFKQFISVYSRLPAEERPRKLRKVLKSSEQYTACANDFVDLYCSEGYHPLRTSHVVSDHQDESCPYKQELEKMDTFYSEFLAEPFDTEILSSVKQLCKYINAGRPIVSIGIF